MARKKKKRKPRRGRAKGPAPGSARMSVDFWGTPESLPAVEAVKVSADPFAVARSLGRPPFSGHEAVSEHYLRAVYQSTAKLAEALATAGGIAQDSAEGAEDDASRPGEADPT